MLKLLQLPFIPVSNGYGLLLLRLVLGFSMLLLHGRGKMLNFAATAEKMNGLLGLPGNVNAGLAVFAEVFCSILLIIGLLTRLAALMCAITMLVAFFFVHKVALVGVHSGELAMLYLTGYLTLLICEQSKAVLDGEFATQPAGVLISNTSLASAISLNLPSFLAATGICAAFFMPWITVMGLGVNGSTLGNIGRDGQLAWLVLMLAAASGIAHLTKPSKALNVIAGMAPFLLLFYCVDKSGSDLFQAMGIGAWLTLICGVALMVAPVKTGQPSRACY